MQSGSLGYISEYLSDSSTSDHSEALLFCLCNAPSTHYCRNAIIMWLTLKCIFSPVDTHDAISNCSTLGGAKKKKTTTLACRPTFRGGAGKEEGKCHVREDELAKGRRRMEGGGKG